MHGEPSDANTTRHKTRKCRDLRLRSPHRDRATYHCGIITVRVLSVDGGGYLGLATASFIGAVEDHFSTRFADRFDLFCGTSTGAIIALALASGKSGREVTMLYQALGPEVFPPPRFWARRFP